MKDIDVVLVQHFLIEAGKHENAPEFVHSTSKWSWLGPGVWTDIDEAVFAAHPEMLRVAAKLATKLGEEISLEYLESKIKVPADVKWGGAIPVGVVIEALGRLDDFCNAQS